MIILDTDDENFYTHFTPFIRKTPASQQDHIRLLSGVQQIADRNTSYSTFRSTQILIQEKVDWNSSKFSAPKMKYLKDSELRKDILF